MVEMHGIKKSFAGGAVLANDQVDFFVNAGEIHALLGENGAGKTTLMNILYGLYQPEEGKIVINGEEKHFSSPTDAIACGIGMIHQHFKLVEAFTVTDNVMIGLKEVGKISLKRDRVAEEIRNMSEKYHLKIDSEEYVEDMPVGRKQRVEIIKAFSRGARILIMDEPTAVLTPDEVKELFQILQDFRADGGTVIYISHKLSEIMEIADRITVMRLGKKVGVYNKKDVTEDKLAELMVGREVHLQYQREVHHYGSKNILKLNNVSVDTGKRATNLKDFSLDIEQGEIVGIAGVDGNGQETLEQVISGLIPMQSGEIFLDGENIGKKTVRQRIDAGVGYLSADRMVSALVQDVPIKYNLILKSFSQLPYTKKGMLQKKVIDHMAEATCQEYQVKRNDIDEAVKNLSGGNQQKVALAREICREPKLLIISQPTRGVDIGAMEFLHKMILSKSRQGMAVLLISSNLDEVLELSDRVLVMYEGKILGEFNREHMDIRRIGILMAGVQ